MGKGAGGVDGVLQLAGGILVGGYALYQMTKEDKPAPRARRAPEQDRREQAAAKGASNEDQVPSKPVQELNRMIVEGEAPAKAAAKQATTIPCDADEVASYSSASSEESFRPSWMTSKPARGKAESQATQRAAEPAHRIQEPQQQPQAASVEERKEQSDSEDYTVGEADDGEVPSWMSRRDPKTRLEEVPVPASVLGRASVQGSLVTANEGVSNVALAFSDAVFVYPAAGKAYFGDKAAAKASHGVRNLHGHVVDVQVLETRAGAGGAVLGALSNGASTAVLASSSTLRQMLPTMFEIASQRLPAVFHVSAATVNSELAMQQDLSDVMAVRDAGFAMLSSGSAQETHDMAVLSHVLSAKASTPLVHFFDGSRGLEQFSKVAVSSEPMLRQMAESQVARQGGSPAALAGLEAASPRDCPHFAQVVEQTMQQLAKSLGQQYHIMEYVGSPHAEAVIVATGTVARVVEQAVASSRNVGVLKVRLLKPWSAAHLLAALPASVRRVCVLDQSGASQPLFAEVAASFHSEAALARNAAVQPMLVGGRVLANSQGFSPAMVHAVLSNLLSERPQANFTVGDASVSSLHTVDMGAAGAVESAAMRQIAVFAPLSARRQLDAATHLLAEQLATRTGLNVQQLCTADAYAGDAGVARAELRMAADGAASLPESYAVQDAAAVLVHDAVLASSGAAAVSALREGGTLVVLPAARAAAEEEEETTAKSLAEFKQPTLPAALRAIVARKGVQVVTVDASSLLRLADESGAASDPALLETSALWIALAAAVRISNGPQVFEQLLVHLKNALRSARPFGDELALVNVVSSSLARVDGYMSAMPRESVQALSFGAPVLQADTSAADFETQSFGGSSFGGNLSPIMAVGASAAGAFVPRLLVNKQADCGKNATSITGESGEEIVRMDKHKAALTTIFPEAYQAAPALRPSEHGVFQVRLTKNKRLTPADYSRNIFHLEFDISGTSMTYQIGDALGVYGHNDEAEVDAFIAEYGLNPDEMVSIPARGQMAKGTTELVSVRNLLVKHLDLFGKPGKKFYVALAGHATSRYEYLKLMHTGTDDAEAYKLGVNEGTTYADLLLHYKTANPTIDQIVAMVPYIKARHYSIASSMKLNPRSVHLLVVAVDWQTPLGRKKYGQCTRYLASLDPSKGEVLVSVDVMPSILRLPPSPKQPIIMSGLGTGLAPFRAFVEERKYQKEMGMEVGPVVLYFGARHRHQEWLYGDEWEKYFEEGLVTKLGLAFSRDQDEKVYIQDKISEDKAMLKELLGEEQRGYFYLCGPTWPVPHIAKAISEAMNPEAAKRGEIDFEQVEKLKKEGRYLLEVY